MEVYTETAITDHSVFLPLKFQKSDINLLKQTHILHSSYICVMKNKINL